MRCWNKIKSGLTEDISNSLQRCFKKWEQSLSRRRQRKRPMLWIQMSAIIAFHHLWVGVNYPSCRRRHPQISKKRQFSTKPILRKQPCSPVSLSTVRDRVKCQIIFIRTQTVVAVVRMIITPTWLFSRRKTCTETNHFCQHSTLISLNTTITCRHW